MNKLSPANAPALLKHRSFIISRMFLLQLVALSIVALAVGLTGIASYRTHVYKNISSTCDITVKYVENYCNAVVDESSHSSDEIIKDDLINNALGKVNSVTKISIFIFDKNGVCLSCSENTGVSPEDLTLPGSIVKTISKKGEYISDRDSILMKNKSQPEPMISKGLRFYITEKNGDSSEYYLFTGTQPDNIENFIRSILIAGIIVVVVMLSIYLVFITRFVTKYVVKPESLINRCAKQYAQGDFSEKFDPDDVPDEYHKETLSAINQIADNLKSTSEQQMQFVSNVSHELRTPMTIISGYINGMLDGTIPKEKRTEYLYIVSQEMQRLKILVSSMLNLTKYDNGTIQIKHEDFVINDLFFRTLLMFENRLEKRNITVEGLDCDSVHVYGDSDLIGQVVYNLTENAVKFVDTNGKITIRLEETKDASIFAIGNTGPGISKDELPKIFGRFYKSDFSRSQDKTGLGLGLDIIRKILRLHDGQISVSSEENVFTEFVVSLPKKQTETRE